MTEETSRRGRPRPEESIQRDDAVFRYLEEHGADTRNAIAAALGIDPSLTYLALDRLRKVGRVKRCLSGTGFSVWSTETEQPCP